MRFSVIIPSYNSGQYLKETLRSIEMQRREGAEIELIVIDGGSRDNTGDVLEEFQDVIDILVVESDDGPANAINKGLRRASGDVLGWLNCDDLYEPGALVRVATQFDYQGEASFCFGRCRIIDAEGREIRSAITRFKEFFFPFNCRFLYQCINYISQPGTFFSRRALQKVGPLREDMVAAWDYEFFLRLWSVGRAQLITGPGLSSFRWHEGSISGTNFDIQFTEELQAAAEDAGRFAPQTIIHHGVRWGIVTIYQMMAKRRQDKKIRNES